jgi:D-alanyl-D-alanine carboxypeptidase (penicillin-binding protein 5/6)
LKVFRNRLAPAVSLIAALVVMMAAMSSISAYAVPDSDTGSAAEAATGSEVDVDSENDGSVADGEGGAGKYGKAPELVASSAILVNAKTGDVLFEKSAGAKRWPASCTKILTALLAIENLDPNEMVEITGAAVNIEGSSIGLIAGEQIRADDLIYGALLESGNDAAAALAVGVDGTLEKFAERMNSRVAELGLSHTNFVNPHGLDDPKHYTTARDLAVIACEAMKNARFRKYVSTYQYTMSETNLQPKRYFHNSNRLLYDTLTHINVYGDSVPAKYPDITGIKTGFTDKAGNCIVVGMKRDDKEFIAVVLKSQGMASYSDAVSMLEYGMHNFDEVTYHKKGYEMFERPVEGSELKSMKLVLAEDLIATVNKNKEADYSVDGEVSAASTSGALSAPIKAGDVCGIAWVKSSDGKTVAQVDLVAAETAAALVDETDSHTDDGGVGTASLILTIGVVAVLAAVLVVVISVVRSAAARRRRRANRMYGAKLKDSVDPREVRRIKNINKPRRGRY